MFNGARNVAIRNGMFVVKASSRGNLNRMIAEVAPNAILNAGGRADEVRCYPGTREEVIGKLEKWMDEENSDGSRMMWLSGPAGAGKSAIFQTVAERCREHGQQAANFFFFRGDDTRSAAQPLVATLAYQLLDLYPTLCQLLTESLATKPLLCKASIEEQFRQLISLPIQMLQQSSGIQQPIILIIDGLDECDNERQQEQILGALHALVREDDSPFRVLVASRAEPHLVMCFNRIGRSVDSIFLDDGYRPEDDIRRFVIAKFDEIKKNHHLAQTLSEDWPTQLDIDAITTKSSGQFIYAATVMRFIQHSSDSPYLSLVAVCEMQPATDHNPLAQLDAVYTYIFSKARDIRAFKLVLCARRISKQASIGPLIHPENLLQLVGYETIKIQSLFANLAAIVKVDPGPPIELVFYHASLDDYLKDKFRSGVYHVDEEEIAIELASICLQKIYDSDSLGLTFNLFIHVHKATAELSKSLLDASKWPFDKSLGHVDNWDYLISALEKLYYDTDKALFKRLLKRWVRFAYIHNVDISESVFGLSGSAARCYKKYRATEGIKFPDKLHKQ